MLRTAFFVAATFLATSSIHLSAASPSGWSPVVVLTGAYREQIKSMPIHQRPGRPLHVYGNTVRLIEQGRKSNQPVRPFRQIFLGTSSRAGGRR